MSQEKKHCALPNPFESEHFMTMVTIICKQQLQLAGMQDTKKSDIIVETRFFLSEPQMHPLEFTSSHEVLVHAAALLVVMANPKKSR